MLLGAGCKESGLPTFNTNTPANIAVGEQKPYASQQSEIKEYVNTTGDYSFSYPSFIRHLEARDQKLSLESDEVFLIIARADQPLPDGASPVISFKLIKTTVYPEHKIGLIAGEYFKGYKTSSKQIKINNLSGWEISSNDVDYFRILYFPRANNELLVLDYSGGGEPDEEIISTLKSIK